MKYIFGVFIIFIGTIANLNIFANYEFKTEQNYIRILKSEALNPQEKVVPLNVLALENNTHYKNFKYVVSSTDEFYVELICETDCIGFTYEIETLNENTYSVMISIFIKDSECINLGSSIDLQISFKMKKANLE